MKVIIAGSRDVVVSPEKMEEIVKASGFEVTEVISGTCKGIDQSGEEWANSKGIPVHQEPPNTKLYTTGRANLVRNAKMVARGEALIAIATGGKGTNDTITKMKAAGKPVFIWMEPHE